MITLNKLNKFYNKGQSNQIHVINDITLSLPESGMVAFFGPSGCGKTTLLNVIGGLDKYESGELSVMGALVKGNTDDMRNQNIGYIFQNYNLSKNETCFDNIAAPLHLVGIHDENEIQTRVMAALSNVGMEHFAKRKPDTLSGGQQQRIAIARAIVKNPPIILADEPTGNLDEINTVHIMNLLKEISKTHLVLLVTHEANLVDYYCDQVIELKDGQIVRSYENQNTEGYHVKGKNDIYLGDFEKKVVQSDESYIEYYGEKPEKPFACRLVFKEGKFYLQLAKGQAVQILDASSEVQIHEGVFQEEDNKKEVSSQIDMTKLPPVMGTEFGKLFTFKSAVRSGYESLRLETKKGSRFLRVVMSLFAAVMVLFSAMFGTSIRTLSQISKGYNHNVFYMYFDTPEQYLALENGAEAAGIDSYYFREYNYPDAMTVSFLPGSFETFAPGYSYFGESFSEIKTNAVPLPVTLIASLQVVSGKKDSIQEGEIVITTQIADNLLEKASFSYIKDYDDLLGLSTESFGERLKIVGIVKSDEMSVYLNKKTLIEFNNRYRYNFNVKNARKFSYSVSKGNAVFVDAQGSSIATPTIGSTILISGETYIVTEIIKGYESYNAYLSEIHSSIKLLEEYLFDKIQQDDPTIQKTDSSYESIYQEYFNQYYSEWLAYYSTELPGYAQNRAMISSYSDEWIDERFCVIAAQNPTIEVLSTIMPGEYQRDFYYSQKYHQIMGTYPTYDEFPSIYVSPESYGIQDYYQVIDDLYEMAYHIEVELIYSDAYLLNEEDYLNAVSSFSPSSPGIVEDYSNTYYYATIHSKNANATKTFLENITQDVKPQYDWLDVLVTPETQRSYLLAESWGSLVIKFISLGVFAAVMSLCMFFIMRSSLMNRVKSIGIYRAIGVSKKNLSFRYQIESLVITTCTTLIGYIVASVIMGLLLRKGSMLTNTFYYPVWLALIVLLVIYGLSVLFGTLPVRKMMRKTPSEILSKYDI